MQRELEVADSAANHLRAQTLKTQARVAAGERDNAALRRQHEQDQRVIAALEAKVRCGTGPIQCSTLKYSTLM